MIAVDVAGSPDAFNCATCGHKNCDDDGARPGSRGPASFERWEIKGIIRSNVCLLPMISSFSHGCLALYRHYQNGVMLRAGGILEQPQIYLQAMEIIDANRKA